MLIGYARVSKTEQDTELQIQALRKVGVRNIFQEKRSAVKARPELGRLLQNLREGDTVVVYKMDRLARSLRDLLNIVDHIESVGAGFRSLTESIDTTTPVGEMAFHMLGALAQFERKLIRERSLAGVEAARANGVRIGRLPALNDRETQRLADRWETGRYTKAELGKMFGVSVSTVKRTLWRRGLDTISDAHANGMLPPAVPMKKARTRRASIRGRKA
jgi:DNA invertase Pin-like site-specific DNA recombinase